MHSLFTALFDANVFYPAPLRDLLLQLAYTGLFRARWTDEIMDEWINSLLKNRDDLTAGQLERTRHKINSSVLDCLVVDYECLVEGLSLPDPKDRHVLAAAIRAQAQVVVTFNLKDFPPKTLSKFDIEAQHPDTFLRYQMDLNPPSFLSSVKTVRERLKKPPKTVDEYLLTLIKQGLPQTASALQQYSDLI